VAEAVVLGETGAGCRAPVVEFVFSRVSFRLPSRGAILLRMQYLWIDLCLTLPLSFTSPWGLRTPYCPLHPLPLLSLPSPYSERAGTKKHMFNGDVSAPFPLSPTLCRTAPPIAIVSVLALSFPLPLPPRPA